MNILLHKILFQHVWQFVSETHVYDNDDRNGLPIRREVILKCPVCGNYKKKRI